MNKFGFQVSLLILLYSNGFSQLQRSDSSVAFFGNWNKGDSAHYLSTKTKERYTQGKLSGKAVSTTPFTIKIIDATDSTYTIEWKYGVPKVNGQKITDPMAARMANLVGDLAYKYTTDELGTFIELLNWKEVQAYTNKMLNEMMSSAKEEGMEKVVEETRKMFSTQQSIENVVARDLQLMHNVYGVEFVFQKSVSTATQLPNILGGAPFPAEIIYSLTEINESGAFAILGVRQEIEEAAVKKAIQDMVDRMKASGNNDVLIPDLKLEDASSYTIDLKTGWMRKVNFKRMVDVSGVKSIEIQEFSKLD